jgi:galactokinase
VTDMLRDEARVVEALRHGGLRDGLEAKADLVVRADAELSRLGAQAARRAWFVPGRIEVLGKHTDYCGGRSLVAAVERGITVVAAPRSDGRLRFVGLDVDDVVEVGWDADLEVPDSGWRNYPLTVARRLARNFPDQCRRGADVAIAADLPPAAGMSSSSALIIAVYQALAAIEQIERSDRFRAHVADTLSLAEYLGTHENGQSYGDLAGDRGVGTFGGSEDHTAILCSDADGLGLFRYCPTRFERRVRVPPGWVFALGVSGVVAEKTGAAQHLYNRASLRVRALVDAWRAAGYGDQTYLAQVLASAPDAGQRLRGCIAEGFGGFDGAELATRLQHFEREETYIDAACAALERSDLDGFGGQVARSQADSHELLGNQVPETIFLAESAQAAGAPAASAFGAGFGGCVWALVPQDGADEVLERWSALYHARFPERQEASRFFLSPAGPAAFELGAFEPGS